MASPPRTRAAWIRRYPYSALFASNSAFILIFISACHRAVSLSGRSPPFVEAGFRHLQPAAHLYDRGSVAQVRHGRILSIDEIVFLAHRCSLAKYAAAFFMNASPPSRARGCVAQVPGYARHRPTVGSGRPPAYFLPVRLYPEPESGIVNSEFPCHFGDRRRRRRTQRLALLLAP